MKVKELKSILSGAFDDDEVFIADTNQDIVAIVDASVSKDHDCVYLFTRHEFPNDWFDKNDKSKKEVRYVNGAKVTPAPDTVETDEILVSDEKLGLDELPLEMTFHDGYACDKYGNIMKYPKVCDLTDEQLEEIDRFTGGRVSDSGVVTPNDVCLLFGELFDYGIMAHGSHGDALVDEINIKWLKFREYFKPILIALYTRDIDEIYNSDAFAWGGDKKSMIEYLEQYWDLNAENYLMHIADDQDLETILTFVRYDVSEDGIHG